MLSTLLIYLTCLIAKVGTFSYKRAQICAPSVKPHLIVFNVWLQVLVDDENHCFFSSVHNQEQEDFLCVLSLAMKSKVTSTILWPLSPLIYRFLFFFFFNFFHFLPFIKFLSVFMIFFLIDSSLWFFITRNLVYFCNMVIIILILCNTSLVGPLCGTRVDPLHL